MKANPKVIEMANKFDLPVHEFSMRADGRIEWMCAHGVGHTVHVPMGKELIKAWWIHGCCEDSCCNKLKEIKK